MEPNAMMRHRGEYVHDESHALEELLEKMYDEECDFYEYVDLIKDEEMKMVDDQAVSTLKAIAIQESEHFKRLYDLVFVRIIGLDVNGGVNGKIHSLTEMEKTLYHHMTEVYKEMTRCIEKMR